MGKLAAPANGINPSLTLPKGEGMETPPYPSPKGLIFIHKYVTI